MSCPTLGQSVRFSGAAPNSSIDLAWLILSWRRFTSSSSSSHITERTGILVVSTPKNCSPSATAFANCCMRSVLPTPPAPNNMDTVLAGNQPSMTHSRSGIGPTTLAAVNDPSPSSALSSSAVSSFWRSSGPKFRSQFVMSNPRSAAMW